MLHSHPLGLDDVVFRFTEKALEASLSLVYDALALANFLQSFYNNDRHLLPL